MGSETSTAERQSVHGKTTRPTARGKIYIDLKQTATACTKLKPKMGSLLRCGQESKKEKDIQGCIQEDF